MAHVESSFRNIQGQINKNDIGVYQINIKVWDLYLIEGADEYQWEEEFHATAALAILMYNLSLYYANNGEFPEKIYSKVALYHNPTEVIAEYERKIERAWGI